MNNYEKLNSIIEYSKETGLELGEDFLRKVDEQVEAFIKEEILPALIQDIAPHLEPIKRDLVLVVEYHPEDSISVELTRKTKISGIVDDKTLTPKNNTLVKISLRAKINTPREPTKHTRIPTKGLRVTFPDGTVICHRTAIETFIDSLQKIGLYRIPQVGIEHGKGFNLVSKVKRPTEPGRVWQHESDGWYIYSHLSNFSKADDLKRISDYFKLGLKIDKEIKMIEI